MLITRVTSSKRAHEGANQYLDERCEMELENLSVLNSRFAGNKIVRSGFNRTSENY